MYKIFMTLKEYNDVLYSMICIKITSSNGKIQLSNSRFIVMVTDGDNSVSPFLIDFSGNQKEIYAFFTVDAFDNLSNEVSVMYGYTSDITQGFIANIDNISPLPSILANIPHHIADNNWLNNLQ